MTLSTAIVGGGPAGLFLAYLLKRGDPSRRVRVIEQNPRHATYGFGVALSGRAVDFVGEDAPEVVEPILDRAEIWSGQTIVHQGEEVLVDGGTLSAIARLDLLALMQDICEDAGVEMLFERRVDDLGELADCDLIVGADGANSAVRERLAEAFGTETLSFTNRFAWYGVATTYPTHTLTFVARDGGAFCGHHYRYTPEKSTFVAECDETAWFATGMDRMDDDERRRFSEAVFADALGGRSLITNKSSWRPWTLVRNQRWSHGNITLIGDALRTAHPSIGSGTRLAMEDALALWRAVEAESERVPGALARYERERRPVRDKLNDAALKSIAWYEEMGARMDLGPYAFAYDYLMRTGRMSRERLLREAPDFMRRYDAACAAGESAAGDGPRAAAAKP